MSTCDARLRVVLEEYGRLKTEEKQRIAIRENLICATLISLGALLAVLRAHSWYVMRGIFDHADPAKTSDWQGYAGLTAAACPFMLLDHGQPFGQAWRPAAMARSNGLNPSDLSKLTRLLMDDPAWLCPGTRQEVLNGLPGEIAGYVASQVRRTSTPARCCGSAGTSRPARTSWWRCSLTSSVTRSPCRRSSEPRGD